MAVGIGVKLQTQNIYGMGSREGKLLIDDTRNKEPFNFFAIDSILDHGYQNDRGLSGVQPYFTGHSSNTDCALMWLNSALTYIDVIKSPYGTTFMGLVSESG
jgi:hypothetical protein